MLLSSRPALPRRRAVVQLAGSLQGWGDWFCYFLLYALGWDAKGKPGVVAGTGIRCGGFPHQWGPAAGYLFSQNFSLVPLGVVFHPSLELDTVSDL